MILNQDPKLRPLFRDIFDYAHRYLEDKLDYTPYEYIVIDDVEQARQVVEHYMAPEFNFIGYDGEWKGKKFTDDEVMYTFQFCCEPHKAVILDISKDGKTENLELLHTLRPLLERKDIKRLGWNIRADDKRLRHRGFQIPDETIGFDGMKAMAFIDSRYSKGLEIGIKKFTNYPPYYVEFFKTREALGIEPAHLADVKFKNPEVFYRYAGGDAVAHREACLNMMQFMKEHLPQSQLDYYYDIYLPLSNYLLDLETTGIPIDLKVMEDIWLKYTTKYTQVCNELKPFTRKFGYDTEEYEAFQARVKANNKEFKLKIDADEAAVEAGYYADFNPASAPQKKRLLFELLKLEPAYYTKSGKSPKPRAWYNKQKKQTKALYSPSTNGKTLATLKFELGSQLEENQKNNIVDEDLTTKYEIIRRLLDIARIGVFATKFLNKQGTEFVRWEDEEDEDDGEEGLKSSYWNALCADGRIRADFFECLANFRSSSRVNVQNPASKVLSHIPDIFVPGYSKMSKDERKIIDKQNVIPANIRHIFYGGGGPWKWAENDVAGADLMISAYLSGDQDYIADMLMGNFHLKKAKEYFKDESITKDDYSKYVSSKAITFRVAYTSELIHAALPIQAEIFAESGVALPVETVEYALRTWERYTKLIAYREKCKAQVSELGYIENARGFKYHFEETENFGIKAGWLNESLAFPIASELACFIWDVSVKLKEQMKKDGVWLKYCFPVNTVHDAAYHIIHEDLMKDNYFPELCKEFFTDRIRIATGDALGMEMSIADRWKGKDVLFHGETAWDFDTKQWNWK